MPNSAQYEAAMQKFRTASAAWRQAQADYRSRKSGDKEFLTAKAVFKKAEEEADLAESKEKRSDGEMCKSLADRAEALAKRFDAFTPSGLSEFVGQPVEMKVDAEDRGYIIVKKSSGTRLGTISGESMKICSEKAKSQFGEDIQLMPSKQTLNKDKRNYERSREGRDEDEGC